MAARRSARRRFDDDGWEPPAARLSPPTATDVADDDDGGPTRSSYPDATPGPLPAPGWVVTSGDALDTDRGVLKTGKEADVSLLERSLPGGPSCLLAAKRYRAAEHRMFHRDAGYLEGRRVKESREMRAIETRTAYGRRLIAGQWAAAEFAVLSRLWSAGAAVPYPVQLLDTELVMEFVGSTDGTAAPRLAEARPSPSEAAEMYRQLRRLMVTLAEAGYAHGDLSPYNLLVHDGRLVMIDLPQAVDVVVNPRGIEYLRRDCDHVCRWFTARGVAEADPAELFTEVAAAAGIR